VFVVNLIDKDDMIAPQLKSYFSSIGLNIIDIDSGMKAQRKEKPLFNNRINYQKVQADPVILTDMILDTLKQKYEKNYNTNIFQNINSGISLQVFADRMFEKGGLKCLIVFNSLPEKICDIISEQRIPLLIITSKDDSPSTVVKKVLDFCGAKYKPSPAEFNYERSNKSLIRISVPGYFMPEESGGVLFTDVSLQEPILKLLSEKNIKIIQY
jgi:hypothetical protein